MPKNSLPEVYSRIEDCITLLADTVAEVREICADLRPPLLDYAGLRSALDEFSRHVAKRTGIAVKFAASKSDARLTPEAESALFRIAQEALTNCAKHSRAKTIDIKLVQAAARCTLSIADDGIGFDPKRIGESREGPGLGLLNMRERAEFIGGTFSLESESGQGTRIKVII